MTSYRIYRKCGHEIMKKLFLDYEKYSQCREFATGCDYFYHPVNDGMKCLLELAAFSVVCRKCEKAPCVNSCPKEALEKQKDGVVKKYNMRCIACKSCVLACPFGTIYPEIIEYLSRSCDFCLKSMKEAEPLCVTSANNKEVLKYVEAGENPENHDYAVGDNMIVHAIPWKKEEKKKK